MKKKDMQRIFTADNLLRIRKMAAEGSSSFEIAEFVGSTPASVRVMCCQHKIKIGRRRHAGTPSLLLARLPASLYRISSEGGALADTGLGPRQQIAGCYRRQRYL